MPVTTEPVRAGELASESGFAGVAPGVSNTSRARDARGDFLALDGAGGRPLDGGADFNGFIGFPRHSTTALRMRPGM